MSSAEDSQAPLSILVKSPADVPGTPALPLTFPLNATVHDVKAALERGHPRHPSPASQRLIHAGKLLTDNATLANVLTGTAPQVLHLVMRDAPQTRTAPVVQTSPPQASSSNTPAGHIQEVEEAFARVLHHQQRYLALVRSVPPASVEETAAELAAVRAAVANYDECVQRQRNPNPAGSDGAGLGARPQFVPPMGAENPPPLPPQWAVGQQPPQAIDGGAAWVNGAPMFPAGAGPPRQGHVWRRAMVFQFDLHWGLLLKLGVFVFVLAQEGSPRRTKLLAAVALVVYLWQTGHLGFLRRLLGVLLPSPTQLFSYLSASAERGVDVAQVEGTRPVSTTWRLMVLMSYIYSFFYGFVCSLLPSWNPEPLPQDINIAGRPQEVPAAANEHAE